MRIEFGNRPPKNCMVRLRSDRNYRNVIVCEGLIKKTPIKFTSDSLKPNTVRLYSETPPVRTLKRVSLMCTRYNVFANSFGKNYLNSTIFDVSQHIVPRYKVPLELSAIKTDIDQYAYVCCLIVDNTRFRAPGRRLLAIVKTVDCRH